jgi:hypothetical protein
MTRDDIIKLAREAGIVWADHTVVGSRENLLERFATLVATAEREDILRMSESQFFKTQAEYDDAIRARGNK